VSGLGLGAFVALVGFPAGVFALADLPFGNKPKLEPIKLKSELPAVAAPKGRTVQLVSSVSGKSIESEAADILKEQVRALLLRAKGANFQMVDSGGDTVIKFVVTGYEKKTVQKSTVTKGTATEQVETWIGNMQVSVEVEDHKGNPIEGSNLKYHLEDDFVAARTEGKNDKLSSKGSKSDMMGHLLSLAHGGSAGEDAKALTGSSTLGGALDANHTKKAGPPTDVEWRDSLIEGMAKRIANEIVPIETDTVIPFPEDKQFAQLRAQAAMNHWGDVKEAAEKLSFQKPSDEGNRLYILGLSYEALAGEDSHAPQQAEDSFNEASKDYRAASKLRPGDRDIQLAELRIEDAIDHYLEVQRYREAKTVTPPAPEKEASNDADNDAVISMVKAKLPESVILNFIKTAPDPKFDVTQKGLIGLSTGGVSGTLIEAEQSRMSPKSAGSTAKAATPTKKPVKSTKTN
jgi:hypothetical protein